MIPAITASKIYSILGNNNSLVPLAIKDVANSMGLTAGSYITGDKTEGKDRFIDEFGTQAIWLFGIPIYKKLLDWTIFKPFKFDPKVDPRIMHDKEVLKQAFRFADESVKGSIKNAAKKQGVFKGLTFAKFAASTALTIFSYGALTKFRYKHINDEIKQDELQKQAMANSKLKQQLTAHSPVTFSQAFSPVHGIDKKENNKQPQSPSFTGNSALQILDHFMFSPSKNLMLVDAAITTERLAMAETKQDFAGYVVKEGSFWAFMYFAGQKIQDYLENKSKYNIGLDARVIESEELNKAMKGSKLSESLGKFAEVYGKSDAEIYKFINQAENQDNLIVQFAKKSDIIETFPEKKFLGFVIKKSDKIDNRRYINIGNVKNIYENLDNLKSQLGEYLKKNAENTVDSFLGDVKTLKRNSVLKNMGACIGALGIVAPAIMVAMRFMSNNKEFERKQKILAELQQQGVKA